MEVLVNSMLRESLWVLAGSCVACVGFHAWLQEVEPLCPGCSQALQAVWGLCPGVCAQLGAESSDWVSLIYDMQHEQRPVGRVVCEVTGG